MPDQEIRQSILDEEHLKLLSIGYYVSAGLTAFFSLFALLYMAFGFIIVIAGRSSPSVGEPPPAFIGGLLAVIGLAVFALMILGAVLKLLVGFRIKQRRSRIFCMIVAGVGCLEIPYGTLIGVFTLIVLGRDSVRARFESAKDSLSRHTETTC